MGHKLRSVCFSFMLCLFMLNPIQGCKSFSEKDGSRDKGPGLHRENSCSKVKEYFINEIKEEVKSSIQEMNYYRNYYDSPDIDIKYFPETEPALGMDDIQESASFSQPQYSGTNIQEKGVDEPDFIKTNGNYIFIINGMNFMVFNSWPASNLSEISRVQLDVHPIEMFVSNKKVILFSNAYNSNTLPKGVEPRENNLLKITIYDIADPSEPFIERETYVEGYYLTSRKIENLVYVLAQTSMYRFQPYPIIGIGPSGFMDYGQYSSPFMKYQLFKKIDKLELEEFLPKYFDVIYSNEGRQQITEVRCSCENIFIPDTPNGRDVVSLLTFDIADSKGDFKSTAIVSSNGNVYASGKNLYIAATNNSTCSGPWREDQDWGQKTYIHKFSLDETPSYLASGMVEGFILNQFSMSEYEDYFRIATTTEKWDREWRDLSLTNNIFVMAEEDSRLDIVGQIDQIAQDEKIYAARFIGKRGFLVTYRQIDPLFTLDLSDPYNPQLKGELEMPGFSTYLHPLGENHLIGIGQNADEPGSINGLQLAIYDVSNLARPERIAHKIIGSGWATSSEALYNHKAFTYYAPLGILSIPVSHWSRDPMNDNGFFNGTLLFDVDKEKGFSLRGEIDHVDFFQLDTNDYDDWYYYLHYSYQVNRNIFIGDDDNYYIYTISGAGIKVNDVEDLEHTVAAAPLSIAWDNDYPISE